MKTNKLLAVYFLSISLIFSTVIGYGRTPKKKIDLDLVYIGNSITHGAKLKNPGQDAPPVVASELLQKKADINSTTFTNQGRSGYTTVDFLPGHSTFNDVVKATQKLHTNASHQLVFSIMLGANDSAITGPTGAPVSKEDYQKNLKAIVDELLRLFPDSKAIIHLPLWYSPNTQNTSKYLAEGLVRLKSYIPEIKSLVNDYANSHPEHVYLGDQKGFAYFKQNYKTDLTPENGKQGIFYLHPNKKGAVVLATFWANAIDKIVE